MKGLHHVGITVKDLDASIRFYHDVLGLELQTEPSPWFDGPGLGPAVGVPGAALRQVCLQLGETIFQLLEERSPPTERAAPRGGAGVPPAGGDDLRAARVQEPARRADGAAAVPRDRRLARRVPRRR